MACGATLKRSVEFDALLSPQSQSPKRRRCMPLTGPGTGAPSPQKYLKTEPAAFGGESSSAQRLTPGLHTYCCSKGCNAEQIFQNIKQEYSRFQWRRQLEGSFNQSETNSSAEGSSNTLLLNAPSSPEQYDAFVKFTHDQIMRRYGERPASYVS
uniref:akirin-1 isoform X3 n=1 Tax=Pristiophorus japonicus TaxID=55135 RepID=UPI00398EC89A